METGKLIKELRIKKGMTQEELADLTELSTRTIQRIENGEVDPRAYTLQMIAKALEVDFSTFIQNEQNEHENPDIESHRRSLALLHVTAVLPLFFPSTIIYNRKKGEIKEMKDHYHAVISFQSTILFIGLLCTWGYFHSSNPQVFYGIIFLSAFFPIRNALRVLNGLPYRYFGIFKNKDLETKYNAK